MGFKKEKFKTYIVVKRMISWQHAGFAAGEDPMILGKAKKCRGGISPASTYKFRKIYFAASRSAFILS